MSNLIRFVNNDEHVVALSEEFVEALEKLVSDLSFSWTMSSEVKLFETVHGHIAHVHIAYTFHHGFVADGSVYKLFDNPLFRYVQIAPEFWNSKSEYILKIGLKTKG